MPFIDLGRGFRTQVDPDVLDVLGDRRWRAARNGRTGHVYAVCSERDPRTGRRRRLRLHQEVAKLGGVPGQGPVVDHLDGNPLNNLRRNLRRCSAWENAAGRRRSVGRAHVTPYLGVTHDRHGRAVAQITHRGRNYRVGTFIVVEEAARARDRAARQLRGPYATVNFPDDDGRRLVTRVDPNRSRGKRVEAPFDREAVLGGD